MRIHENYEESILAGMNYDPKDSVELDRTELVGDS